MSKRVVRVIDLHEREKRHFPRWELVGPDGLSLIFEETRALSALELREVYTGIELRALGLIGYLPLTDQVALNLHPRFPLRNFWQMLSLSDEQYDRFLQTLRGYSRDASDPPHLLLVRSFCFFLRSILTAGISQKYLATEFGGYYRPKMHFGRTVNQYLSRGDLIRVAGTEFVFSRKPRINGVFKAACIDFLKITPRVPSWDYERALLMDALNVLSFVPKRIARPSDIYLFSDVPIWLKSGYMGALQVYFVYKGFSPMGFSYEPGPNKIPSFLFKLDDIFEQFVRNGLRAEFARCGIVVSDGNRQKKPIKLFKDNNRYPIKPDAIVRRGNKVVALVEMKYKPKIRETDRYQGISHILASGASLFIWISPSHGETAPGLEYIGSLREGKKFYHYRLDISGDLDKAQTSMHSDLLRLINSSHSS